MVMSMTVVMMSKTVVMMMTMTMYIPVLSGKFGLTGYGFGQGAGTLLSVSKLSVQLNTQTACNIYGSLASGYLCNRSNWFNYRMEIRIHIHIWHLATYAIGVIGLIGLIPGWPYTMYIIMYIIMYITRLYIV